MKPTTWPEAWACLPALVSWCPAGNLGGLALLLAARQQRGDPPPAEITTPDRAYIHVVWPGVETVTINEGGLFSSAPKRRRGAA